jgi:hypothetical protein
MALVVLSLVPLPLALAGDASRAAVDPSPAVLPSLIVPQTQLPQTKPPRSNEAMEFSVSYLGLPLGKARLFVGHVDATVAPVFLQAQTSSILSFITLRQQLATYLDVLTGLPRTASLDSVEGKYRHTDTVQFDRSANKATVRIKGKHDNTYVVDTPPGTIDFVGLVYKLRALPLEQGSRHHFPVLAGRRLKNIVAEVVGREKVSTKVGSFPALKVRVPTGFSGKFSEKNPTTIWFSDDDRRIVVRITSDFSVGHATATLVSYSPGSAPPQDGPAAITAVDAAGSGGQ